jgi:hypothetical protein
MNSPFVLSLSKHERRKISFSDMHVLSKIEGPRANGKCSADLMSHETSRQRNARARSSILALSNRFASSSSSVV